MYSPFEYKTGRVKKNKYVSLHISTLLHVSMVQTFMQLSRCINGERDRKGALDLTSGIMFHILKQVM